jgi:hypothetical protein
MSETDTTLANDDLDRTDVNARNNVSHFEHITLSASQSQFSTVVSTAEQRCMTPRGMAIRMQLGVYWTRERTQMLPIM